MSGTLEPTPAHDAALPPVLSQPVRPAELDWFFALIGLDRELELVDQAPGDGRHGPGAGADALPIFTW